MNNTTLRSRGVNVLKGTKSPYFIVYTECLSSVDERNVSFNKINLLILASQRFPTG